MKVGSVFRRWMAKYGSGEEEVNVTQMHVLWILMGVGGGGGGWVGGQSIMIWGAIGIIHKVEPVIFQNISTGRGHGVTALRYINQVLWLHIVPYFGTFSSNTTSQSCHGLSPDLNPFEHLCDEIHGKLNEVRLTAADLSEAFLRIWAAIPITFINRLIHPMYRRCVLVVNAHGRHSRYWLVTPRL